MIRLTHFFLTIMIISGCKTTQIASKTSESESLLSQSELHCKATLPSEGNRKVIAAIRFPAATDNLAMIYIKRSDDAPAQAIASTISSDNVIIFEPNNQDRLAIRLDGQPRISNFFGSFHEDAASPCVQLLTNAKIPTAKQASCNAAGTPAQGWYQSGKILKLSSSCANETLFCGAYPSPGWYVQKKSQKVLAKAERCGFQREMPVCKTSQSITGWHVGERLISRDDECSYKQMECAGAGTKTEGWYVYERSTPSLLVAGSCHSNRDISYLSH